MPKTRKTKKEKVRSNNRAVKSVGFKISEDWLKEDKKDTVQTPRLSDSEKKFFRADLTKTFLLTMLVLALEIALWQYLSRH